MNNNNPTCNPTNEFVFQVPDEVHQMLFIEIAGNHGLQAFIRSRSKRRVWILGAKPEVDAVAATAQRLALQLKVLHLNAVFKVLLKHKLIPSLHLARLISLAEVKAVAAGNVAASRVDVCGGVQAASIAGDGGGRRGKRCSVKAQGA